MNTNPNQSTSALQRPSVEMPTGVSDDEGAQQSYWERLPTEIMEDIFLMCLPLEKNWSPCKTDAPYLLTCVCRSWYDIVAEFSKMWSTIVLTTSNDSDTIPPSRLEAGARHVEMCITRSKRVPLDLYVRAEFIAYPASFEHIQRADLQQLILRYPSASLDPLPTFFPLPYWDLPNIITLEVHTRCTVSISDQMVLNDLLVERPLRKFVCVSFGDTRIFDHLYFPNTSNLEVLILQEDMPISTCFLILQSAPSLRQLSLTVGVFDHDEPAYSGMEPFHPPVQPFIHPNLQYLALTHLGSDISTLFDCVALPSLHFLVLSFEEYDVVEAFWPHDDFIAFLQRSGCKLRSFHVHAQPITPSQLLELLQLPQLADSLEYLGIQNCSEREKAIDDSVLEKLTLPSSASWEAICTLGLDSFMSHPPVLCPNIERIILFVSLESITISKLIAMFDSRLPWNASSAFLHKFLRHIDMEAHEGINEELGLLHEKGLTFYLGGAPPHFMPPAAEQNRLWRRYLMEGLDDEFYDPFKRAWSRDTMAWL